jgi:hypothetical protein
MRYRLLVYFAGEQCERAHQNLLGCCSARANGPLLVERKSVISEYEEQCARRERFDVMR